MRKILIVLPILLCSSPAFAQPAPPPQLPPELTDPATVHQLIGSLDQLSRALMNVRIGEAKAALTRYLAMKPDAPDAAWVRQTIG